MSKLAEQLGIDMDAFRKHSGVRGRGRKIEESVSPEQRHLAMLQKALTDAKEAAAALWELTEEKAIGERKERQQVYFAIDKLDSAVADWKPTR